MTALYKAYCKVLFQRLLIEVDSIIQGPRVINNM